VGQQERLELAAAPGARAIQVRTRWLTLTAQRRPIEREGLRGDAR
jgi:hypothetical protein